MKKIEQVYREILYQSIEQKNKKMTQLELSKNLGFSLSTINLALKKLGKINAVRMGRMNFAVIDIKKILYLWASARDLEKDIVWRIKINMPVRDIERNMPETFWGAFSAYKFRFKDVPADYSEVYVYADEERLNEIKKRFNAAADHKNANLFVLKADENIKRYDKTVTVGQIFVDLWNLKKWYAADFLKSLEERLNG